MRTKETDTLKLLHQIEHACRRACEFQYIKMDEAAECLRVVPLRSERKFVV